MSKSRQPPAMDIASRPAVRQVTRSGGKPPAAAARGDMDLRFVRDFSAVRTHTDPAAAAAVIPASLTDGHGLAGDPVGGFIAPTSGDAWDPGNAGVDEIKKKRAPSAAAAPKAKPQFDLTYHPKFEPPDPDRLPPEFFKPLPPPPKGSESKTLLEAAAENLIDPLVDSVASGLSKDKRDLIKHAARGALKSGAVKAARAGAEAAGVKDKAALDAIEKTTEAVLMQKEGPSQ